MFLCFSLILKLEVMNMENYKIYDDLLLEIFNLSAENIQSIRHENKDGKTTLFITLVPTYLECPDCGNKHVKIKGYVDKKITHSVLTDRSCTIMYKARRYVCPVCHTTYYEKNPFVFERMKISILTIQKILEDLKNFNETFSSIGNRYHISPTSVCSIFDQHVDIPRKRLPEYINFDEVYAFKSEYSKYVCVLLDYENQTPIDILPSRRIDYLREYFSKIPIEERKNVKGCCFDMYDAYRTIGRTYFPNASLCVDHFHVAQELHRQLQQVRIDVMKKVNRKKNKAQREMKVDRSILPDYLKYSRQYYLLKHWNWLLMKDEDDSKYFSEDIPQKYNHKFKRPMNYLDLREELLDIDSILNESYQIKNIVSTFYKTSSYEEAPEDIEEVIQILCQAQSENIRNFGKTFKKWKHEIINSFKIVKEVYEVDPGTGHVVVRGYKMNNAIIENKNSIIKCIKKNANGFTNWHRFRNRLMYVLGHNETYRLYPKPREKKASK